MIMGSLQQWGKIDTTTVPISHFQENGNDVHLLKETYYLGPLIDVNLKRETSVK